MQGLLHRFALTAIGITVLASASQADVVTDWNATLLQTIKSTNTNPPRATRAMAMVHCAIFDAVNAVEGGKYVSFHPTGDGPNGTASAKAAAGAAAHRVLVHLYPAQTSTFDAALAQSLQGIPNGHKQKGIEWGLLCADQIIALRANDGSAAIVPYTPMPGPGFWQPTPPAFGAALLPNWPTVACWAMETGSQFRSDGPPALSSAEYLAAFNEVKELGALNSATRTAEQSEIALFWADGAGTFTPPGHWNVIARNITLAQGTSVLENARLFALLNCALADAAICSWDNKYAYNHWRPITGIQQANSDGNGLTAADPTWASFIATPPFPAYTSGHSTFSSAGAKVLAHYFGIDAISFSTTSDGLPGVTRSFNSLWAAAEEAGMSRVYGGIHWQYDNQHALEAGSAVAQNAVAKLFKLRGDLNGDDVVTHADLVIMLAAFGACDGECAADLNHDGVVNGKDVKILVKIMN